MPPQQPSTSTNHIHSMSAVATFKTSIVRIRDILRGPGVAITGMDSMRHICLYVLARYVDMEKAKELGVPEKFAWEELMRVAQTVKGGVQFAFDLFYHKEEDCLIAHFDRLFGTEKFSFDIKSPAKHKEIMEIVNRINVHITDECMDLLGWVYEQHLGTGSSSASRDLGQYFTHRAICEYMVRVCNPGFEEDGVPESICDPTMGTGGFLTTVIKHYRRAHADKPIDWKIQCKEIHGCDTDPKVAGIARLNLFMETGGHLADNLLTHDSLYDDLPQSGYKVILANMPFGVKQLVHADCCERVKDLKIRTTKSEPLFLQLMMVSLKLGGRCAVVVPDGMLVNTSNGHNGTRKYLLDNFELRRVIKMSGQFFMNTSIQPSILFFENTGNPTTTVEFWNVVSGANGDIQETMVLSVPRENLDAACSFDMRRYQEVKAAANPAGFPMVKISDKCSMIIGGTPLRSKSEYYENGHHVWVSVSELNNAIIMNSKEHINDEGVKHSNVKRVKKGSVLMSFKLSIGKCAIAGVDLYTNEAIVALHSNDESILCNQYLFYYLSLHDFSNAGKGSIGVGSMNKNSLSELTIQLPPLSIQQEIVATLDHIYTPGTTELAETLKLTDRAIDLVLANPGGTSLEPIVEAQRLIRKSAQMVADVKAQMVAIINASAALSSSAMLSLKDVCSVSFGERITKKEDTGTLYPVYGGGEANFHTDKFNRDGMTCKIARFAVSKNTMVLMINQKYWLMDSGFTVNSKDITRVSDEYLWWILWANQEKLAACSTGSCQKNINMEMFYSLEFGFPLLETQRDAVSRINLLHSQLSALESLQKQSEDNARFILDSYLM